MLAGIIATAIGVILTNGTRNKEQQRKLDKAQQIRRLLVAGKSCSEVAQITNSPYMTVCKASENLKKNPVAPEPKLFSTEQRVRCLYDTGMNARQIAKKVNRNENEIEVMIHKYLTR